MIAGKQGSLANKALKETLTLSVVAQPLGLSNIQCQEAAFLRLAADPGA